MKRTITEKFDETGNLIERVTVEEDGPAAPHQPPAQYQPIWVVPYYLQPPFISNVWHGTCMDTAETVTTTGGTCQSS